MPLAKNNFLYNHIGFMKHWMAYNGNVMAIIKDVDTKIFKIMDTYLYVITQHPIVQSITHIFLGFFYGFCHFYVGFHKVL